MGSKAERNSCLLLGTSMQLSYTALFACNGFTSMGSKLWYRGIFGFFSVAIGVLTGCSGIPLQGTDGTVHRLILGIGVVSTPKPSDDPSIYAATSRILGIGVSQWPEPGFTAGYASQSTILVPKGQTGSLVTLQSGWEDRIRVEKSEEGEKRR